LEIQKARTEGADSSDKIAGLSKNIADMKAAIADITTNIKNDADTMATEENRAKGLEGALDKALSEEKDIQASLRNAGAKRVELEGLIAKAGADVTKNNKASVKNDEAKSLGRDIDKLRSDEDELKQKTQESETKIADLRKAIDAARTRIKEELAVNISSGKQNVKDMEKGIASSESEKGALKNDLQRKTKKLSVAEKKRNALMADIDSKDKKISDLKSIIEKQMVEINVAEEAEKSGSGLACKAEAIFSKLNDKAKELRDRKKSLEKELRDAKEAEKDAKRKAESEKKMPAELQRVITKERLEMHYNLAVVYDKNGIYKDAEREYLKCLDIDPKDAGAHYNLGILYDDKLNNNHKASTHYKRYLELRPMGDNATQVRGWLTHIEFEERVGIDTR
jgi:tetratricopeptide (TPR) repeat protein